MIFTAVTAHCDAPDCDATQEIPATTTQPFLFLSDRGWEITSGRDDVETFCPEHQ